MTELNMIPVLRTQTDPVEIVDRGEGLVAIGPSHRIFVHPIYYSQGVRSASSAVLVRLGTWEALRRAAASIPEGLTILVLDGLRTLDTQWAIQQRLPPPECSDDGPAAGASEPRYVYPAPRSADEYRTAPPPHTTGGAIDVTLADAEGKPLDLGAGFDQFDHTAWLRHYESSTASGVPQPSNYRHLRRQLYWAMVDAGFAPYPWEYWHFEYQTRHAAAFYGQSIAQYGAALPYRAIDEIG